MKRRIERRMRKSRRSLMWENCNLIWNFWKKEYIAFVWEMDSQKWCDNVSIGFRRVWSTKRWWNDEMSGMEQHNILFINIDYYYGSLGTVRVVWARDGTYTVVQNRKSPEKRKKNSKLIINFNFDWSNYICVQFIWR